MTVNSGSLQLTGNNTYTGGTNIAATGYVQAGNGDATGSFGTGPVVNNGTLQISRNNTYIVSNAISGWVIAAKRQRYDRADRRQHLHGTRCHQRRHAAGR